MIIPKAFISYSHDTLEHKKWALELATRLRNNGIDAILDQFELQPGADLPHFMETHLASSDKIIMICTNKYVEKANKGQGGVGYEKMIITSSLMKNIDEIKIIPIIRQNGTTEVPTFLKSKLYINFSKADDFEFSYDELVRTIHNSPLFVKPPIGNNPFIPIVKEKMEEDNKLLDTVLIAILNGQGIDSFEYSSSIIQTLNISPSFFKIAMGKLIDKGLAIWVIAFSRVASTEKGLIYAYDNNLIK
ncbi:toll/interleukin-1 receptor domain-containing protein [Parasediminibacterium paludis]|uniref:Toll/interleukin-1 receptor domain-containing protein n=1 Tax=Parasediminibacterium paludis TaxID=908966 RepID=A0ABV8PTW1_9BACT